MSHDLPSHTKSTTNTHHNIKILQEHHWQHSFKFILRGFSLNLSQNGYKQWNHDNNMKCIILRTNIVKFVSFGLKFTHAFVCHIESKKKKMEKNNMEPTILCSYLHCNEVIRIHELGDVLYRCIKRIERYTLWNEKLF